MAPPSNPATRRNGKACCHERSYLRSTDGETPGENVEDDPSREGGYVEFAELPRSAGNPPVRMPKTIRPGRGDMLNLQNFLRRSRSVGNGQTSNISLVKLGTASPQHPTSNIQSDHRHALAPLSVGCWVLDVSPTRPGGRYVEFAELSPLPGRIPFNASPPWPPPSALCAPSTARGSSIPILRRFHSHRRCRSPLE